MVSQAILCRDRSQRPGNPIKISPRAPDSAYLQQKMCLVLDLGWFTRLYLALIYIALEVAAEQNCDKVFSSYSLEVKEGVFQSPGYPSHYPNSVKCTYKFIARANERVKIQFTEFALQGRPPSCKNDYVNIYSQLQKESDDLLEADITGPFCGETKEDLPKVVVSTKNILVIWFFSNAEKSNSGFYGTWEFIDAVPYEMGTVAPNTCGYTVRTEQKPRGYIISSTYPGVYPDSSFCYYRLQGKPGQRIKLTFEDFSLFYGGEYCPFDYLKIYDGPASDAPVIGKFCGSFNRSTVIYSTKENLRLEFITGEGRLNFIAPPMEAAADYKFERRGFNISYVFSDRFVSLDDHFIKEGAEHVSGTDCDQRIMSGKETNGTFVSPGYPAMFPEGVVCRYYLDGLMDDQYLEKVKVSFFDFNIPGNMPYCLLGYLGENEDMRLSEGTVRNKYCGSFNPPAITSGGPRMVITLNTTGAVKGGKFVARYQFITDFGIPGTPITDGKCKFHYNSAIMKNGEINSPRHPGNYALNQDCEYIFRPLFDEVVIISFSVFHLSSQDSPPCNAGGDYVAFYEDLGTLNRENFTLTEKYCGKYYPGPYATTRLLKLVFFSDERETFPGFKATYKFVKKQNLTCPTHNNQISGRGTGGVIVSPSVSGKYMSQVWCEWVIHASKRENKILIEISELSIEGVFMKGAERSNCEVAVLRLYDDSMGVRPSAAVCGMKKVTDITQSYLSLQDSFKISFLTSAASLGAKGFKISWTEVHIGSSPSGDCSGFQCVINKFCIAPTLKCNKEPNCGQGDDSDETAECSGLCLGSDMFKICLLFLIVLFYQTYHFQL